MNYIGSKRKLLPWITSTITEMVQEPLEELVFCDLFAGTGVVGRSFKPVVKQVIANDIEYYSYVLLKNYIGNHQLIDDYQHYFDQLNDLPGKSGFIANQYGENGAAGRLFFSARNAAKIDACRSQIEHWKQTEEISAELYFFLLTSLLESADKIANTASVYGAYLKKLKKTAQKELLITPAKFTETTPSHQVYHDDANQLIKTITGDILYLDPPYNARQYGANYHLLNTIAKYKSFTPKGITGLPDYNKSKYCKKREVLNAFESLIQNAKFKYLFVSYNNEGLMSAEEIKVVLRNYGSYRLATKRYQRFKADNNSRRNHKANQTTEYLHCLIKDF